MNIYILQHVPFENPGILENLDAHIVKLYEHNHVLPKENEIDLLIILGGPMSVYDNIPWLKQEKALVKELINHKKPILGICLGAQLIAQVLGGKVYPNPKGKEVGFDTIKKQLSEYSFLPEKLNVLHWHSDTFTLPNQAKKIYSSKYCENQAFIYNENVIGLQFHMECTEETLNEMVVADREYISNNILNNTEDDILRFNIPDENQKVLLNIIDFILGGKLLGEEDT